MLSYPVIIVDDHPVIGLALRNLLEKHPSVSSITVYENAKTAVKDIIDSPRGCVVILDLDMPDISGIDLLRLLPKSSMAAVKVLVYTGHRNIELEVAAIRAGAKGFVTKDVGPEGLLQAFDCVIRQRSYFADEALKAALTDFNNPHQEKMSRLSAREYVIAKRLATGESHTSIAETLFISPKTVSAHKAHIFEKLEISTIPQLIQMLQAATPLK